MIPKGNDVFAVELIPSPGGGIGIKHLNEISECERVERSFRFRAKPTACFGDCPVGHPQLRKKGLEIQFGHSERFRLRRERCNSCKRSKQNFSPLQSNSFPVTAVFPRPCSSNIVVV